MLIITVMIKKEELKELNINIENLKKEIEDMKALNSNNDKESKDKFNNLLNEKN